MTSKDITTAAGALALAGLVAALFRKRTDDGKIKSIISGVDTITATGNHKTTVRDAWKNREFKNEAWVIFKDVEEPNENLVWIIDGYDRAEKKYSMYKWADVNHGAYAKGDRVCYTGFTF